MKRYLVIILPGLIILLASFLYSNSYDKDGLYQYKEEAAEFFRVRLLEKVRSIAKQRNDILREKIFWEERVNELFKVDEKQRNEINRLRREVSEAGVFFDKNVLISPLENNQIELKISMESQLKTALGQIKNLFQENEALTGKLEEEKNIQKQLSEKYSRELEEVKRKLDDKNKKLESAMVSAKNSVPLQNTEKALVELEKKLRATQEEIENAEKEKRNLLVLFKTAENKLRDYQGEIEKAKEEKQSLLVSLRTAEDKSKNYQDAMEKIREEKQNFFVLLKTAEGKSKNYQEEIEKTKKEKQDLLVSYQEEIKKVKVSSHYNYGVVYMQNKKYNEAINEYEKALEIDQDYPFALYNLGVLYDSYKKDPEKAALHYGRYLQLMPNADDAAKVGEWLKAAEGRINR